MKIIEEKRKNIARFGDISIGTIFRFNGHIFIKTAEFFSAQNIEEFFCENDTMEEVDDMHNEFDAYTAFCISTETHCPFSVFYNNAEVEIINAELHVV
jgi:hypothetical protein